MKSFLKKFTFHRIITIALIISDISSLFLSLGFAFFIRFRTELFETIPRRILTLEPRKMLPGEIGGPLTAEMIYFITALALIPLWLFLFKYFGLYKEKRSRSRIDNWFDIAKCISLGTLLFLVITFFLRSFTYSRIVVITFWCTDLVVTAIGRVIIRKFEARFREKGYDTRQVILVGHSVIGDILYRDMTTLLNLGFRFIGWVDDNPPPERETIGIFDDIPDLIKQYDALDIFIVDPHLNRNRIMNVIADCDGLPARFRIISGLFDMLTNKRLETISGFPVLEFGEGKLSLWRIKIKRIFDIVVSCVSLVIFSPCFIIIPLLIKLTTRGPALFKQKRIGKDGIPFIIYKFSSMYPDTDPYSPAPSTLRDKRITPVGRLLRRTSLDELPQFINVLKGEMSIVGPRPEMPFLVERQNHWERKRMVVKPGMTGAWQTMGRSDLPLQDHLEFDLYYIRNQSIFFLIYK